MRTLTTLALLLLGSCSTLADLPQLDTMDPLAFERYTARVSAQVTLLAAAGLEAGDLSPDGLRAVAGVFEGLANGTTAGLLLEVIQAADLGPYGTVAAALGTMELDAALERRGAYEGGVLGPRGRAVLLAVAAALRELAGPPPATAVPAAWRPAQAQLT